MATFEVLRVFRLPSREAYVIAGRIIEGTVRAGMFAQVLVDGQLYWSIPIQAIEFVDDISANESKIGLVCQERSAEEFPWAEGLCPPGARIEIIGEDSAV